MMLAFNEVREALEILGYDYEKQILPTLKQTYADLNKNEARHPDLILAIAVCKLESSNKGS